MTEIQATGEIVREWGLSPVLLNSKTGWPSSQFSYSVGSYEIVARDPAVHRCIVWLTKNTAKKKNENSLVFKSRETFTFLISFEKVGKAVHTDPFCRWQLLGWLGEQLPPFSHWEGLCCHEAPPSCCVHLGSGLHSCKHIDSRQLSWLLPGAFRFWLNTCFWINFTIVDKTIHWGYEETSLQILEGSSCNTHTNKHLWVGSKSEGLEKN